MSDSIAKRIHNVIAALIVAQCVFGYEYMRGGETASGNIASLSEEDCKTIVLEAVKDRIRKLSNTDTLVNVKIYSTANPEKHGISYDDDSPNAVKSMLGFDLLEEFSCGFKQLEESYLFTFDGSKTPTRPIPSFTSIASHDAKTGITRMYADHREVGKNMRIDRREDPAVARALYRMFLGGKLFGGFFPEGNSFLRLIVLYNGVSRVNVEDSGEVRVDIEFERHDKIHRVWKIWLDPRRDWMETRVFLQMDRNGSSFNRRWWLVQDAQQVDGLWMPTLVQDIGIAPAGKGSGAGIIVIKVEKIERNSLGKANLAFEAPENTEVNDMVNKKLYRYGHADEATSWGGAPIKGAEEGRYIVIGITALLLAICLLVLLRRRIARTSART